ncbi:GGDEF domain-containing protein [Pseudomonas parafulva]|uniref:cyclic-guanylate-specific phosphodiesterase n=1 Tax=Pseudomonas parafulva TaxID=157782 RepID=A0AAI8KFR8_9PSED|nr:EAL domain-containing protein [Pseudomonas parafulva]AIZ35000.1 diguanylate cyclase [Pseudomonas parafulva]AXO90756.1 GGDEF domain-containing protein [Pseudomonas parafulva]
MTQNCMVIDALPDTTKRVRRQFATELSIERTRLLYQGSLLPTLLMLLNGLLCAWLLWSPARYLLVCVWTLWLLALVGLRVIQVAAFEAAPAPRQAQPSWWRLFLGGSAFSGLTLACAALALVPVDSFVQQAWVFGLLGAAALSASVAYAVSLPAFLSFVLPGLLPPIGFLFIYEDGAQRGWGWLGLILLGALFVVAWQINRLIENGLLRRFQNQALIEHLQQAQRQGERLNLALSEEVKQRRQVETQLRHAQHCLEQRVSERGRELDLAHQALGASAQRLAVHEEQQRLAATVFEAASEGIAILDAHFQVLAVNQPYCTLTGHAREELLSRNLLQLPSSRDAQRHSESIREALQQQGRWQGELVEARSNGELYPQWLQLNGVHDGNGRLSNIVAFCTDLSTRRQSEERLRHLAHYDELTGLANRMLFRLRLDQARQRVRLNGRTLALLHVDLDRFKLLNESLGQALADQLLRQMARRLANAVPEADTVARISGDEFVVLFDGYSHLSSLVRVTTRLLDKLRVPQQLGDHEVVVSASVGISLLTDPSCDLETLLNQADMAKQHAKHLGGDCFQFYTESLRASTLERLQLENHLRKALVENQLRVFYQPKMCLRSGRLNAAEALVRWQHPQWGMVPPSEFIGLAEETGLIAPMGEFVLRQACWQACEWLRQGRDIRVSVNLSVYQLRQGKVVSLVRQVLEETGLAPHLLELELTESQLLDNVEHIIATFEQLHALGVKLAIDDFGTGYSSLSYLKRFPVDYVKIDQAFIRGLHEGNQDAAIIRAIIGMAKSLGLEVVAEGVETPEQLSFLREQGCDEVQGYLISRPLEAEAFEKLLQQ